MAGIFNDYGLDARLAEVGIFPVKKKVGEDWVVADFGIWYGMSGYERMAHNDEISWYFGAHRKLSKDEIEERLINYCSDCKGTGKVKKWGNKIENCDKCNQGRIDPDVMLVYEVPLYNVTAAKEAKLATLPYFPDTALGICIIGVDTSWQTGTLEGKAIKRARKALLKRNFPLQYKMDNMVKSIEIRDPDDEDVSEGSFEESPPVDPDWVTELKKYGYTLPEWRVKLGEMLFGDTWDSGNPTELQKENLVEFGKRRYFLKKMTQISIKERIEYALEDLSELVEEYPSTLEGSYAKLQELSRIFVNRGEKIPVLDIEKTLKRWEETNAHDQSD